MLKFGFLVIGGIGSFVVYAYVQERLMTLPYGPARASGSWGWRWGWSAAWQRDADSDDAVEGENFQYASLVTFFNRVVAMVTTVPLVLLIEKRSIWSEYPLADFVIGAWTNCLASNLQVPPSCDRQ